MDGSGPGDARPPSDVPRASDVSSFPDAAPPRDVFTGPDAVPPSDVPVARDARPPSDVPVFMDVQPPIDVPVLPMHRRQRCAGVHGRAADERRARGHGRAAHHRCAYPDGCARCLIPPDAPMNTIVGRWRAVRYDFVNNGMNQTMTDENSPFPIGTGVFIDGRINGELFVTGSRLAESFGVLLNDHFYINDMAANTQSALSAYGVAIAGSVNGLGVLVLRRIVYLHVQSRRDDHAGRHDGADRAHVGARRRAACSVRVHGRGTSGVLPRQHGYALAHPRLALAWDKPGTNTGVVYSNDVAISFGAFNTAQYGLNVIAPPATAIGLLGGTQVAIAYLVVYDDTNLANAYEAGVDSLRGISSVALVWRAGASTPAFSARRSAMPTKASSSSSWRRTTPTVASPPNRWTRPSGIARHRAQSVRRVATVARILR